MCTRSVEFLSVVYYKDSQECLCNDIEYCVRKQNIFNIASKNVNTTFFSNHIGPTEPQPC